jgi:short-subunit dehydrogenase
MDNSTFKNKVVVITGASGGVGKATAWEFAKQGAKTALLARSKAQLEATKKEVEDKGGQVITIVCDVADYQQVEDCGDQAKSTRFTLWASMNRGLVTAFACLAAVAVVAGMRKNK